MAKRLIDSDIFKKGLLKQLPAQYKLFWIYIFCDCSHSGFWDVDFEVASIRCGGKIEQSKAEKYFAGKFIKTDSDTKWFLPDFIIFQYKNELKEGNKAHQKVIADLKNIGMAEKGLNSKNEEVIKLSSPLQKIPKPLHEGDKDMVKDMDMVTDKELDKDKPEPTEKPISVYAESISIYNSFILDHTGVSANIDGVQGSAMKSIIKFLMTQEKINGDKRRLIEGWKFILGNWDRLDDFNKKQLKLTQINSNIINIIGQIKNGTGKKNSGKNTVANITDNDLYREAEKVSRTSKAG